MIKIHIRNTVVIFIFYQELGIDVEEIRCLVQDFFPFDCQNYFPILSVYTMYQCQCHVLCIH
jgi:hypothetical protein